VIGNSTCTIYEVYLVQGIVVKIDSAIQLFSNGKQN